MQSLNCLVNSTTRVDHTSYRYSLLGKMVYSMTPADYFAAMYIRKLALQRGLFRLQRTFEIYCSGFSISVCLILFVCTMICRLHIFIS